MLVNTQSVDGTEGGQCGSYVNDYLETMGLSRFFKDPISQKAGLANSTEAKVGSVIVMDSPTSPEYGHVGIVTAIDKNGVMTVKQSNGG